MYCFLCRCIVVLLSNSCRTMLNIVLDFLGNHKTVTTQVFKFEVLIFLVDLEHCSCVIRKSIHKNTHTL